ncbi:MAG: hypothetical protein GF349_02445 [Candidatus Magasanikbacteria bacterium]|nr:hypothetical protein [Candidatus Magasanikbacteria bacterium]
MSLATMHPDYRPKFKPPEEVSLDESGKLVKEKPKSGLSSVIDELSQITALLDKKDETRVRGEMKRIINDSNLNTKQKERALEELRVTIAPTDLKKTKDDVATADTLPSNEMVLNERKMDVMDTVQSIANNKDISDEMKINMLFEGMKNLFGVAYDKQTEEPSNEYKREVTKAVRELVQNEKTTSKQKVDEIINIIMNDPRLKIQEDEEIIELTDIVED